MSHDDLDREIRSHLELEAEELLEEGLSAEDARNAARRRFGNVTRVKEAVHDLRRLAWLDQIAQDLKLAVRRLRKAPGVAALTIITLAIGIAASTTIFSAADAILWHPLPFKDASRIVGLRGYEPANKSISGVVSLTVLDEWQVKDQILNGAFAYDQLGKVLTGSGAAEALSGGAVSCGAFNALGVHPALGRDFMADDFLPRAPGVVILSDGLWRERFGGRSDVIGQLIVLGDVPHTVVGVMPPGFTFPFGYDRFWVPFVRDPGRRPDYAFAFGRLRPGTSLTQAQAFAETTTRGIADPSVRRLREIRVQPFVFRDRRTVIALRALLAAVALLLLIAIANAANVRLAQAVHRDGEMAVRASLGASASRLARQVVTEALLVSTVAAGVSLALSAWATSALAESAPLDLTLESLRPIALDWRAFAFAAAVTIVTSIGVAWMPILRARRPDVLRAVRGTAVAGQSHAGARHALLVLQVAITLVLLVCASLLGAGFVRLLKDDPGYAADRILAADVVLPVSRYPKEAAGRFYDRLRHEAARLPGIEAATVSASIPPHLGFRTDAIETLDHGRATSDHVMVAQDYIDDGFFETLGIPVVQGRTFRATDDLDHQRVAVIGRALAERLWPDGSAVGRQFRWAPEENPDEPWWTVVGIVGDVKNGNFQQPLGESAIYYPRAQEDRPYNYQSLVVRTAGSPAAYEQTIRELVQRVDPDIPVVHIQTADEAILEENARVRFATFLMIVFAGIALVLALVGIYGAFWYAVSERTRELGVRVALGATPRDIVSLVLSTSIRLAIAGLAIGLALTLGVTRLLRSLLFETSPTDPGVLAIVTAGFLAAVLFATWIPARRASHANPMDALRDG